MFGLGQTELLVILLIGVLLFGARRTGKIAGEVGVGIRNFKSGLTED